MVYEKEINVLTNKQGVKGDSGVGISSITNYYLATNATSVTTSTTGWTTTIQTVSSTKKHLWNYEKIAYTDNTEKSTTPVIIGNYSANGTDGKDGTDGIGIKSIAEKYAVSTSNTTAPTTWKDTPPQMTAANKYLWNYEIITYSNNTTEETAKRVIGAYGDKGATGEQGVRGSLELSGTEINSISDITEATYTITTASTGITSATMPILVGDTYINVTTQDVWICSTAGTPTTAKWKYQGRRCSDKDDSNRFRMFTPATDNGTMQSSLTKSVVKGENPFGKIDDLLKITNTNGTEFSNYTPYNRRTKIDPKKTYRHVTYIKQEDANYTDYIGIAEWKSENSFCSSLSGAAINSAYFTSAANFGTLGRWYMVVGYIVANGTTTAPADSGVYDMVTKQKVRDVTNFQWKPNVTYCTNSGCLIRYSASAATKTGSAYLYDVRLDEVNGTEPSLNELLNLDTTTKSKGTWKASTVYNTGDIVYLNGNSYICTANHTSGTSFSTTNWNLIASKGADGKNAITMTSATTPNGEYNGQIGIWQGQVYQWNGTDWVLTSGILPTDPVLHYSFDEVPDIPDGTNNFTGVISGWSYTKEDIKGGYRFTLNGKDPYIHFRTNIGAVESLALCYRQKAISKTGGTYIREAYICYTDSSYSGITNFIPVPTESENIVRTTIPCDKTKTIEYVRLDMFTGEGHSAVIEVTDMYIGDASYTTPVIDNSGNNYNATNVKGLVTKGVSGKCFNTFNSISTGFTTQTLPLSANWSYSMWCNLESSKLLSKASKYSDYNAIYTGMVTMLFGVNSSYNSYGIEILCDNMFSGTKTVAVNVFERNLNSSEINSYTISPKIVDKGFVNITVSRDNSNTKIYCDGLFVGSFSKIKTDLEIDKVIGINIAGFQGGNYRTRSTDFVIDDFQIFDRALSDQEVLGLYLARGNTPKQYTMADYYFDNSSGKYYGYEKPAVPFKNDTYLNTTTGYLYEYDGVKWVAITDVSDSRYNQAVNDMIAFATKNPDLPFITARNAWIERLAVDGLLANKIATQELKIRDGGSIHSDNYNGTIKDGVITKPGTKGWAIDCTGAAEFMGNIKIGGDSVFGGEIENPIIKCKKQSFETVLRSYNPTATETWQGVLNCIRYFGGLLKGYVNDDFEYSFDKIVEGYKITTHSGANEVYRITGRYFINRASSGEICFYNKANVKLDSCSFEGSVALLVTPLSSLVMVALQKEEDYTLNVTITDNRANSLSEKTFFEYDGLLQRGGQTPLIKKTFSPFDLKKGVFKDLYNEFLLRGEIDLLHSFPDVSRPCFGFYGRYEIVGMKISQSQITFQNKVDDTILTVSATDTATLDYKLGMMTLL